MNCPLFSCGRGLVGVLPYVLSVWPGIWIVKFTLRRSRTVREHWDSIEKHLVLGKWIGIFERWLIIYLVGQDAWTGLGFIIAAKGLLRLPELQRTGETDLAHIFSSYILLGTLVSITLAMILAKLGERLCCGCWTCGG